MHFLPEELTGFPESSDRRGRVRRNPSAIAYLDAGEGNGGIVLNVSETGMAVAVAQALTDDEIPLLTFRLPQLDRTFQAGGEVIWRSASKKSAGVRFVNLDERDRSQIRNWIRAEIVEAELKAPAERVTETSTSGPAKSVLVMPSRAARKAARAEESEAARDEARAAEFDRMFPSEAELANLAPAENGVNPGEGSLLSADDHDDVEMAAEAFLASRESEAEEVVVEEAVAENAAAEADAGDVAAGANHDWREEWEQFHIEREKLEKMRSSETSWELPRAFTTPLPEPVIPLPAVPETAAAGTVQEFAEPVAEKKDEAAPRKIVVRAGASELDWYQAPKGGAVAPGADVVKDPSADAVVADSRAAASPPKTEKDALSIAALCVMLVLMCFILGYAIQPGSFRFSWMMKPEPAPTPAETSEVSRPRVQPVSEQVPVATNPSNAEAATGGATAPSVTEPSATAPNMAAAPSVSAPTANDGATVDVTPKTKTPVAGVTSVPPAASVAERHENADANHSSTTNGRVSNGAGTNAATNVGIAATPPAAAPVAAGNASELTIEAPVPVSFFPVTAPSEGSPAKMMVLPEETILQTHDILIRSHQFLFVPPLAGPESAHELERVHLGDRIAKIDPGFAPQSLEKFQGSSIHLRSTIGVDGRVEDVQAISGPTSLIPAAVSAVRQWRYKPTDIDGKPIAIEEDIVIEVRPSHS